MLSMYRGFLKEVIVARNHQGLQKVAVATMGDFHFIYFFLLYLSATLVNSLSFGTPSPLVFCDNIPLVSLLPL